MGKEDFSGIRNKGPLPSPQQLKIPGDFEDLIGEYVESSASMLQELEVVTLAYEAGKDREENAASVRRILHKLKGGEKIFLKRGLIVRSLMFHQSKKSFIG